MFSKLNSIKASYVEELFFYIRQCLHEAKHKNIIINNANEEAAKERERKEHFT